MVFGIWVLLQYYVAQYKFGYNLLQARHCLIYIDHSRIKTKLKLPNGIIIVVYLCNLYITSILESNMLSFQQYLYWNRCYTSSLKDNIVSKVWISALNIVKMLPTTISHSLSSNYKFVFVMWRKITAELYNIFSVCVLCLLWYVKVKSCDS